MNGPFETLLRGRYPCIKDLSRLGRDMARTVLVDDTPLAFCRQPDNGIPVFNFRCAPAKLVLPHFPNATSNICIEALD